MLVMVIQSHANNCLVYMHVSLSLATYSLSDNLAEGENLLLMEQ